MLPYIACLLTLVGYISVTEDKQQFSELYKKKKIVQRFLSMIDYDASHSLSNSDDINALFAADEGILSYDRKEKSIK